MKPRVFAAAIAALIIPMLMQPVQARHLQRHHRHPTYHSSIRSDGIIVCNRLGCHPSGTSGRVRIAERRHGGCPPNLGCGCNLANYFHIVGRKWRELWRARAWAHEGAPAAKGCTDCVAVLTRRGGGHVGIVKGYDANGNPIIYSYANARLGWTTASYSARRVIAYRSL